MSVEQQFTSPSKFRWPEHFMWGTGASSTQCEGASLASDWLAWEEAGNAPRSGDGNGFSSRYAADFELFASLGLTHYRLSIDWARVEPSPGVHDRAAIDHYLDVLSTARDAGIEPWVCLHHFTLPRWFADAGGFLVDSRRTGAWARHVDFAAEAFGELVSGWKPVNETNYYARLAYRAGGWPPGVDDREQTAIVDEAIHLATAEAALRLRQTGKPVASIYGLPAIVLLDDDDASHSRAQRLYEVNWAPGIGLFRDGVLKVADRPPLERHDLAGAFDLFGFSYYFAIGVAEGRLVPHPSNAARSPQGFAIFADGLRLVLGRLQDELPGTPLLVSEYGIGTADDEQRAAYLERGLEIIRDALAHGVDVRGLFHWTGVDNYEWLHGFDVQFGIADLARHVRPSAAVLQRQAAGAS